MRTVLRRRPVFDIGMSCLKTSENGRKTFYKVFFYENVFVLAPLRFNVNRKNAFSAVKPWQLEPLRMEPLIKTRQSMARKLNVLP